MEEEILSGEQPLSQVGLGAGAQNNGIEKSETQTSDGSPFGKFKDATSLLSAYNNLQAEFTRKSQKLSLYEKNDLSKNESVSQPAGASENREMFKRENWKAKVNEFFSVNPTAKTYSKEISKVILNNADIAKSEDCLNLAYKMCLAEKFKEPAVLADDEEFLKTYIVNNPRAKELIINEYINSLKTRPIAPAMLTGKPNNLTPTPPKKLSGLDEARKVIEKMFK